VKRVDEASIDREIVRKGGLYEFVKLAFPYVEPCEYVDGRAVKEICLHLEAVTNGEIKRLVINVPPGFMKSMLTCVFWPTWVWATRDVKHKWIFASYDKMLCYRDAERSLELMQTPWFQARWGELLWPDRKPAVGDIHTQVESNGQLLRAGWRFATSVMGKATGRHANTQVIDDPHKPTEALAVSKVSLKKTHDWLDQTMSTRAEDPANLARVLIMQRITEGDLSGYCRERGDYTFLRLPMRFESKFVSKTPVGGDWRTKEGELLWPEKCDERGVKVLEKDLKTEQAKACQLQQRPMPQGGLVFKETWFRYWHTDGPKKLDPNGRPCLLLPIRGGIKSQSWDLRFAKADAGQSRVCGQLWWHHAPYHYLLDSDVGFYGFWDSIDAIKRMSKAWPEALGKLIENKANGPACEETLSKELSGIELVDPKGGKLVRCFACQPTLKSGHVVIPHPDMPGFGWVNCENGFLSEVCGFPNSVFDDQPDAMSQHLNWSDNWTSRFLAGMKQAKV
jgi:predicted phage terminase large subunit-like protein